MTTDNAAGNNGCSLLGAARLLAGAKGDESAIVEAFRALSHTERCQLGAAMSAVASVLYMDSKFQPVILDEKIKIPVTSFSEGIAVQEALFKLGCGFHNASYPLTKEASSECLLCGIFVSRKGVMSVVPNTSNEDVEYVANHESRNVTAAAVLQASVLGDLIR